MKTLTNGELIAKLQSLPQDAPVYLFDISTDDEDEDAFYPISNSAVGLEKVEGTEDHEIHDILTIQFSNRLRKFC